MCISVTVHLDACVLWGDRCCALAEVQYTTVQYAKTSIHSCMYFAYFRGYT